MFKSYIIFSPIFLMFFCIYLTTTCLFFCNRTNMLHHIKAQNFTFITIAVSNLWHNFLTLILKKFTFHTKIIFILFKLSHQNSSTTGLIIWIKHLLFFWYITLKKILTKWILINLKLKEYNWEFIFKSQWTVTNFYRWRSKSSSHHML